MKKLVAVGALLAALVAGCGGVTSTPEDTGRSTMDAMAGGPGQAGKACDYYTATYAKSTTEDGEADSCEEAMTQGVILAKGFGIDFSDIEVGGEDERQHRHGRHPLLDGQIHDQPRQAERRVADRPGGRLDG
jgi:hypothetical protein